MLEFLDPDGITAPDAHTVTFTTKEPVVELPVLITNKFTNIVPEGAKHEDLRLKGDGTGPFMQEQFTPNAPVRILRKNPNYWDAGKPKAECLRVTVAQEPVAAVSRDQGRPGRPRAQRRSLGHPRAARTIRTSSSWRPAPRTR